MEKRGQRRRKIKPVILIVTEGSQTKPKYFEHYRSRQTNIDIRVVGSRTSGGETDYLSLIRKAVEYQSKNQISVSDGDSVWVVADGDVNYNNPDPITVKDSLLTRARKMADAKGIQNAKRVEQYHLQNESSKPFGIAVNPFTDIYRLVEYLTAGV